MAIRNPIDDFFEATESTDPLGRPTAHRRRKTPKKDLEAAVLKECLTWLQLQGYYYERRNTGAIKTDDSFFRFGSPGAADIFAVIGGRHIEIECKRRDGKGRLSVSQEEFRRKMNDCRIPYFVVRSADELAEAVGKLQLHWTR